MFVGHRCRSGSESGGWEALEADRKVWEQASREDHKVGRGQNRKKHLSWLESVTL